MTRSRITAAVALLLAVLLAPFCRAEEPNKNEAAGDARSKTDFIRLHSSDKGDPLALETAIVSYVPSDGKHKGLVVDLIGAVHVGEEAYYKQLNETFKSYDALLYELVARKEDVPKLGRRRESEVSGGGAIMGLQSGMKNMLGLEHQLDGIDYTAKNFVHADMSPGEFARSMKDRDESFTKLFFRMLGQGIAIQSKDPARGNDLDLLSALFSTDRERRELNLKRAMANQFSALGGHMAALDGPDGSTLITERNKKALEVLKQEIDAGKKKIAIFYGAGHLADMEQRLLKDFGLKRETEQWVEAWNLRDPAKKDGGAKNKD